LADPGTVEYTRVAVLLCLGKQLDLLTGKFRRPEPPDACKIHPIVWCTGLNEQPQIEPDCTRQLMHLKILVHHVRYVLVETVN
jgi:hypothetical protein